MGFLTATFDVRSSGDSVTTVMRSGAQTLAAPIQESIDFVIRPVMGFVDGISNVAGLSDQNERLKGEVRRLEQRLRETSALERRVAELEAINDLAPPEDLATVTARIYSAGASTFDQIRLINRGSGHGIVLGQAVVDEDGLVGRVDLVTNSSARVRLITDPLVSVGVRVQDTNQTGVVTGRGDDVLRLDMFDATQPVSEGAVVLTDGSLFPPGIVVGFADETKSADVGFALRTTVDPAAAFSRLDFVKVVVGWSPLDADPEARDPLIEPPPFTDPRSGLQ
ncbi:MAG: rod shape-determining protein MreC [Actinomycetota bacterium]|nr:rod shape-determining protein MreC [Actinomycetota bacterium]